MSLFLARLAATAGVAAMLLCLATAARASQQSQKLVTEAVQLIKETPPKPLEAAAKLREATEADPQDSRAWFVRGVVALTEFFAAKEALEHFDKAAAIDPAMNNVHFGRGRALSDLSRHAEAIAAFEQETNKDANPLYSFYRGIAHKKAKKYAAALADLDKSDQAYPGGRQSTQLHRGDIYAAQGKIADARTAYNMVVQLDAASPLAGTARERLKILAIPTTPVVRKVPTPPLAKAPPPKPKRLFVRNYIGIESDSNVALIDEGEVFPRFLEQKSDERHVAESSVAYYPWNAPGGYLGFTGDLRRARHFEDQAYDDDVYGLSIVGGLTRDRLRLGGQLRRERVRVDGDGYTWATHATLWSSYQFTKRHRTLLAWRHRWRSFDTIQGDPRQQRDGETDFLSVTHTWRLWESAARRSFFEIEPGVRWAWERTYAVPAGAYWDNDQFAYYVTLRKQIDLFRYPTLIEGGIFNYDEDYVDETAQLAINFFIPFVGLVPPVIRVDEYKSFWLHLEQPIHKGLSIELNYRAVELESNLLNTDYKGEVFSVGLTRRW